ncbi:MAG: hypothetical protein EA414_08760 [Arthrospira sp. PLM2.Bin9]|nr:MAG: hypothetical protein EA414_08760 [Arthrospira sp. PLM2.Bin9]
MDGYLTTGRLAVAWIKRSRAGICCSEDQAMTIKTLAIADRHLFSGSAALTDSTKSTDRFCSKSQPD